MTNPVFIVTLETRGDTRKTSEHERRSVLVFVYGTLTDPDRVAALLEDEPGEYAFGDAAVLEGLHRVDGRYPTLAPGGSVEGRLLRVDDRALERLDQYEGVDRGLYVRVAVPGPDETRVWTYVGAPERLDVGATVDWPDAPRFRARVENYLASEPTVVTIRE